MISIPRSELRDSYDAIVVGAGVGGLVCAGFLARGGKSVLLLDHHYLPGGYCTAFPRKQHLFDAAVHHIGACGRFGVVGQILSRFEIDLELVALDPMDHLIFPDSEFVIPACIERYSDALERRFPEEKHRIPDFFRDLVRLYRQVLRREGALLDRYRGATFGQLLADYFEDTKLKRILGAQWGYLGSPVEEISAVGMCQMLVSYLRDGAYYPRGSTQAFSDALARSILEAGGHVLLRTRVVEVLVDRGRAAGVRVDGGRAIRAASVVSNVDARQLFCDLVPQGACERERRRIQTLQAGPSYFGLYLALAAEVDLSELPRGFYYLPQDDDNGADGAIEWIYLSVTTRYDAALAPSGNQIVSATVGVRGSSPEFVDWQDDKQEMARRVLDYLGARVPGLERGIEFLETASPRTLARYTLSRDGVAYGWAVLPDQSGDARLRPETSLPGLWLTGQWTTPGPGVAAVAASGWSAANRLLSVAH